MPTTYTTVSCRRFDAKAFKKLAAQRGAKTVAEQAQLVNLNRTHLYKLLKGEHQPTLETADQIADLLGVEMDVIYPRERFRVQL